MLVFIISGPVLMTPTIIQATSTINLSSQYEFPDIGLKINYPADWEKIEYGRAVKAYGEGLIANLFSPIENGPDKFREFVQLRIENSTPNNIAESQEEIAHIGENPVYQITFERSNLANKSDSLNTLKTWSPLNGKILVIEFSDTASEFSKSLPLALKIIDSVQINGVGMSSTLNATDQYNGSLSSGLSAEDKPVNINDTTSQTSSIIEKLMERGVNMSEIHNPD
jgi:hypothetical protein